MAEFPGHLPECQKQGWQVKWLALWGTERSAQIATSHARRKPGLLLALLPAQHGVLLALSCCRKDIERFYAAKEPFACGSSGGLVLEALSVARTAQLHGFFLPLPVLFWMNLKRSSE